ncbi:alpha/beta fold hydrolase [Streptomyces sp. NPDC046977]|uniref:alpha/beta fold hydrolase n=1 Tax=Streptomyces sp. NPDC046977 TaxID=3154703 RepID=UPI0033D582E5
MRRSPPFVMVPGAWHGGWSWQPVARLLRAAGNEAVTLTLPGLADGDDTVTPRPEDAVRHIVRHVERLGAERVVLVAHSWGGYPVTNAAFALGRRVAAVIYCNALLPAPGRSTFDELLPEMQPGVRKLLDSPAHAWPIDVDFVRTYLLQGRSEDLQRLVAALVTPMPGHYETEPFGAPDPTSLGIPLLYLLSRDDRALPRPGAEFAARLGMRPVMIPGPHDALITHPEEVARAIGDFVARRV